MGLLLTSLSVSDNTISSTNTDGLIYIDPNGNGYTFLRAATNGTIAKLGDGSSRTFSIKQDNSGGFDNDTLIHESDSGVGQFQWKNAGNKRMQIAANGNLSLYEDTGTTAKFFWDASAESLDLTGTGGLDVNTATGSVNIQAGNASADIALGVGSPSTANKVVVTAGGNVGIGTSSPSTALDVSGGTTNQVGIFRSTDATATVGFADNTTPLTGNLSYVTLGAVGNNMVFNTNLEERMRIDASGQLLLGRGANVASGAEATRIQFYNTASTYDIASIRSLVGAGQVNRGELSFALNNGAGQQERMRLDYSGNLLVGKTSFGSTNSVAQV
jgi:hypothetical protein